MKIVSLFIFLSALMLAGCVVPKKIDKYLPEGKAAKASGTVTGKFSNTNIDAENYVKTPTKVTADKIHFKHSDTWISNVDITFEGYERDREPSETEKK
jgi:hypothetical protein